VVRILHDDLVRPDPPHLVVRALSRDGPGVPSIISAGNLFGMTRTCHPESSRGPGCVPRRSRAGVLSSCPSQNGQTGTVRRGLLRRTKSMGRRLRSVAMMTRSWRSGRASARTSIPSEKSSWPGPTP
jgi:hypothetical protein